MLSPWAQVLLTDGSWAPLEWFLVRDRDRRPRHQVRVFLSRRRAQEIRHAWPAWLDMGIGIVPLLPR